MMATRASIMSICALLPDSMINLFAFLQAILYSFRSFSTFDFSLLRFKKSLLLLPIDCFLRQPQACKVLRQGTGRCGVNLSKSAVTTASNCDRRPSVVFAGLIKKNLFRQTLLQIRFLHRPDVTRHTNRCSCFAPVQLQFPNNG